MMDREAVVARVEGDQAFVETGGEGAGCGRCHEAGGCQSGLLGQLFRAKPRQFRIGNSIGAVPGERVIVRIAEGATIGAAMLAYGLPVVSLLLGAFVGATLAETERSDAATALGALAGLISGIACGPIIRRTPMYKFAAPTLVRRASHTCVAKETCR